MGTNVHLAEDLQPREREYKHITVTPVGGALGAEIGNVNLAEKLSDEVMAEIRHAWLENIVVFFRDQEITPQQHNDFMEYFGTPRVQPEGKRIIPVVEEVPSVLVQEYDQYSQIGADVDWHADNSFREIPQKCSLLYALDVPRTGGDTCWANMYAAYEGLSEPIRRMCDELTAIHDLVSIMGPGVRANSGTKAFVAFAERTPPVEHPVVRINPDTGRKALYVNPLMTARIKDMTELESRALLDMLFAHCTQEEFVVRFTWHKGDAAMWDNRACIHRGINNFYPQHRLMHRVGIDEESRPTAA